MASWLKRLLFGDESAAPAPPAGAGVARNNASPPGSAASATSPAASPAAPDPSPDRGGLNFESAIAAHMAWKKRLDDLLASGARDVLDPLQVCRDDQCELGRWLHGPAATKYAGLEGYQRLRAVHADFHQAAARVVTLAQAGEDAAARDEIHRGAFAKCSVQVKAELAKLYLDIGN